MSKNVDVKKMKPMSKENYYDMDTLKTNYGLKTDEEWYKAFDDLGDDEIKKILSATKLSKFPIFEDLNNIELINNTSEFKYKLNSAYLSGLSKFSKLLKYASGKFKCIEILSASVIGKNPIIKKNNKITLYSVFMLIFFFIFSFWKNCIKQIIFKI